MATISPTTRRRLEIQGFCDIDDQTLAATAPWLRLAFALCAVLAAAGTILASPVFLYALVPVAVLAAVFPVHPFDLIYNYGLRYFTGDRQCRGLCLARAICRRCRGDLPQADHTQSQDDPTVSGR